MGRILNSICDPAAAQRSTMSATRPIRNVAPPELARHGADLTKSTLQAYHDGGQQDGQFHDSDFGGALYVAGDEGLKLPSMSRAEHREAKALAKEISARAP